MLNTTTSLGPGQPLEPSQAVVLPSGPRQWSYPLQYNTYPQPRSSEANSFEKLRNLGMLYDGVMLCEQVWLDTVAKLSLVIKPRPELITDTADSGDQQFTEDIKRYKEFFAWPDRDNGLDLKSWMRSAVRDQLQIDAVCVHVRRSKGGGVYSLELVAGDTIKPLLDERGRRPLPPYAAYQQYIYGGTPGDLYSTDDLLYIRETPRSDSPYGLSRIERIILRVNQALRKENRDLATFTEGNIPPAFLTPPDDGSAWTPEALLAYQEMWDALLAGNDQARSRIKVMQPGTTITPVLDKDIFVDFDRFLLNVTAACYSMTMADLGFTEDVNKSSGDSQENVFYRRAVQPLMERYATLFTYILHYYFDDDRFIVEWSGYEEAEDFASQAEAYSKLIDRGVVSPTQAARLMKLPVEKDIPPFIVVAGQGVVFLEDIADPAMRQAANDAKKAGYEMAKNPPEASAEASAGNKAKPPDNDAKAAKSDDKQRTPPGSQENDAQPSKTGSGEKGSASTERSVVPPRQSGEFGDTPTLAGGNNDLPLTERDAPKHTGIMVAFMIKPDVAAQLALPGGEPVEDLHCTLAYLGETNNGPVVEVALRDALAVFASSAQALRGQTGGIARFALSESSQGLSPIIALVNCPGLQEWRRKLVEIIESAGYHVASDFDFTPHITLKYIDSDDPMPVDDIPVLPLVFDTICLAVGDERQYFPLQPTERQENPDFFAPAADSGGHHPRRSFPWRQS